MHNCMVIFTPDTDVLVLAVTHYEKLCKKTSFSMVSGMVNVEPILRALGKEKAQVLSTFHAFTEADNIGKFSGIGKKRWFQQYVKADVNLPRALTQIPVGDLTQVVKDELAQFVCLRYCRKDVCITDIAT